MGDVSGFGVASLLDGTVLIAGCRLKPTVLIVSSPIAGESDETTKSIQLFH